jgi:subtilisin family serine protease
VVGRDGVILATTDGGATWNAQSSGTTERLRGVAFSDAAHGWAAGYGGVILVTSNGGATWSAQSSGTPVDLEAVAFSDATRGWVVGGGTILSTTNGGGAWSAQSLGAGGWYVSWDGTSMATPHVTGALALCAAQFPSETVSQRVRRILDHVDPIASMTGKCVTGGRLDAAAAVIPSLSITKLRPASGRRGAVVSITGMGFGTRSGPSSSSVRFGAKKCATYLSWSATQIRCRVPAKARYGAVQVTVTTTAGTSNAVSFTVKR